ncbi:MAG: immunoglobulin-like domain-containing protein [Plesiomonas sp.]|uniref:immunoglobulin-like domain-containing protein n=1 Tax=Plesiomonas sp. TaxID=2486279 RepID=UPI003F31DCBD
MNMFKNSLLGSSIMLALSMAPGYAVAANSPMVNQPSDIVVGYWHNWCGADGYQRGKAPCIKLNSINAKYNVVNVSFMKANNGESIPTFKLDPTAGMSESEFIEQIAELNRQGRSVLLALGGADAHIELRTGQEQAFADEIIRLVERYGYDGLDIDLEQTAITAANNQTVIPAALRIVKDHYRTQGKNFLITMAPEFPYLTISNGKYIPYITALEGYYDWINPQFYNQGGDGVSVEGIGWVAQNNDKLKEEFIYYISDSLINGTRGFTKIPHDKLVFGIPSNIDAAATGYVTQPQDLFNAFKKLKAQDQPLRGIMTWSINWDMGKNSQGLSYNSKFINDYGDFIHNQNTTPEPEDGKPVFTGVSNARVKQGSHFDPRSGVKVTDAEDGELTHFTVDGFVDINRMGTYALTYAAKDKDNNETKILRQVEVYNMKPVLTGVNNTTIEIGTSFDPLAGVTATDEEDGNLTNNIKLSGDTVNTNKVGQYNITYSVTDTQNQKTTQSRTVTVKETGATCDNIWSATQVYVEGNLVSYEGKTWRAGWWTQGEKPGSTGEWGVWRAQGNSECGGIEQPPINNGDFNVTGITSSYSLTNGNVSIRFNVSTDSAMTIKSTIEKSGKEYGSSTNAINGTAQVILNGINLTAGSHEIVIKETKNGQATTKRIPVEFTSSNGGGGSENYPVYQPGKTYQGGDKVTNNGGNVYECKPFPYSGWCGGSSSHYAPGVGSNWQDAWMPIK